MEPLPLWLLHAAVQCMKGCDGEKRNMVPSNLCIDGDQCRQIVVSACWRSVPEVAARQMEASMLREYAERRRPDLFRPDLFRQMRRTPDEMSRLFGGLRMGARMEFPAVNVWASVEGAMVIAAVPGVVPDELGITVHQNTVTLRGRRDPEAVEEDAVVLRQERALGPFSRTIVLPFRVDAEKVAARFDRGMLMLELPRPEEDKPRHIRVARAGEEGGRDGASTSQ
jgi:HSP20 family protein